MTHDEIIAMAREAGAGLSCIAEPLEHPWKFTQAELARFAALVAAKEREACAMICDEQHDKARTTPGAARAMFCAERIRARCQKEGA